MANQATVKYDMSKLKSLVKSLEKDYFVRVGIIGEDAKENHNEKDENKKPLTNAELGTIHEQPDNDGSKMPKRSFLEMPLKEKLKFDNKIKKDLKKQAYKAIFIKQKPIEFYNELARTCLEIVQGAFTSNGYGSWQSWSEQYKKRKLRKIKSKKKREIYETNHKILVQTGTLRRSVSAKVMKHD